MVGVRRVIGPHVAAAWEHWRMRAITLASFDGVDALGLRDWPDPVAGPGEEVVEIRAVALGPWDIAASTGAFAAAGGSTEFPQQQGWDFAGETAAGRRVAGFVAQPWMGTGTLSERIAVATALLADLPEGLSWAQGASLPVTSLTAQLLITAASVAGGDRVAVTGAAGMVGGLTVQLARARGATVVGAVRGADAEEALRLGAEAVVDTGDDLGRRLGEWAPGGVDACLDTVGLGAAAVDGIREGGRLLSTVPGSAPEATRGITAEVVQVQPDADALDGLLRRAAEGELTLRIAETIPWDEYRRGYEQVAAGGLRGKVVLTL
jgi:NADPH:quinone reductase-like Zn-dependent oxidoreductase